MSISKNKDNYRLKEGMVGLGEVVYYGSLDNAYRAFVRNVSKDKIDGYKNEDEFYHENLWEALTDGEQVSYPTKNKIDMLNMKYGFGPDVDIDSILHKVDNLLKFLHDKFNENFERYAEGPDSSVSDAKELMEYGNLKINSKQVKLGAYGGFLDYELTSYGRGDKPSLIAKCFIDNYMDEIQDILDTKDVTISKMGNITFSI